MPVRFVFAWALKAAAADWMLCEATWTMRVSGMVVVTPVTVTEGLAGVLMPPPVTSHGLPLMMTPR